MRFIYALIAIIFTICFIICLVLAAPALLFAYLTKTFANLYTKTQDKHNRKYVGVKLMQRLKKDNKKSVTGTTPIITPPEEDEVEKEITD
jgi:flagellar biosynthesis component FlhA